MKLFPITALILGLQSSASLADLDYSNCGKPAHLATPAQRLVTLDINSTELALALKLQASIVGVAGVDDPRLIMPEFKAIVKDLPFIASSYPTLSQLQEVQTDLVIGGWRNGFSHGTAVEPDSLLARGIASYVLKETCVHDKTQSAAAVTFESTLFADITAIGSITGADAAAARLLEQMRQRLERVTADVQVNGRKETVRTLVYDGGYETALTIGGDALLSEAIRVAGGRNIFSNRPGTWQNAGWADVVKADPELIIVVDYGSGDAVFKVQDLMRNPALKTVTAIREKHYFFIPYAAAITGIRSVGITELLADHLICTFNTLAQGAKTCLDVPSAL